MITDEPYLIAQRADMQNSMEIGTSTQHFGARVKVKFFFPFEPHLKPVRLVKIGFIAPQIKEFYLIFFSLLTQH